MNTMHLKLGAGPVYLDGALMGEVSNIELTIVEKKQDDLLELTTPELVRTKRPLKGMYGWHASQSIIRYMRPHGVRYFSKQPKRPIQYVEPSIKDTIERSWRRVSKPGWAYHCQFGYFSSRRRLKKAMKKVGEWAPYGYDLKGPEYTVRKNPHKITGRMMGSMRCWQLRSLNPPGCFRRGWKFLKKKVKRTKVSGKFKAQITDIMAFRRYCDSKGV